MWYQDETERSIPGRFEAQARRYPQRPAVKTRRYALTYEALNQSANRLAHALLARRGAGAEPIALLLEHDAPLIAAMLGVLKAGKIVLPLDPYYPHARLAAMREDSQASLILTQGDLLPMAGALTDGTCPPFDLEEMAAGEPVENPGLSLTPDTLAYLLYTSGSTGRPKGVVENHRNVLHFTMNNTQLCGFSAEDRLTLFASCSFSASATPIYGALLNGAALCPLDLKREGFGGLADWLREEEITVFHGGTTFGRFLRTLTGSERFPRVRLVYWGGEPLRKPDVERYRKHFPEACTLVNALGATEMKCYRMYPIDGTTPIGEGIAPVGFPVEGVEVLLQDEAGRPVESGEAGEIVIKSRYLAPAYWRQPELTREKFCPAPEGGGERIYRTGDLGRLLPDGCLLYLGRIDSQVKIRGHRIEVAEIEGALLEVSGIEEAIVVAREDEAGEPRLVAYVVPSEWPAPTVSALRRALAQALPEAMIPSAFVMLGLLRRGPNGKVDRLSLPKPGQERPTLETAFAPPRTPIEGRLVRIWAEVLGLDQVGIHDPFLDLGGESMRAAQLLARVWEAFQVELPVRQLFEAPTVAEMATIVAQCMAHQVEPELLLRALEELEQQPAEIPA